METVGLQKEEKKLLIAQLVGLALVLLLLLGWMIYVFIGVFRLDLALMKKMFASNPETIIYSCVPLLFVFIWILPRVSKLWKDISSNKIEEGTAEVINVKRSLVSRDWLLTLNQPGKEKIKMLGKDIYKLTPGKKIKFRITPSSGILIGYEILNGK